MNGTALTLMIISMVMLWGGLAWSIVNLIRHPEDEGHLPEEHAPEL
ncbi:hypothetical protein GCM10023081_10680 [Arthrobacter ginkgonis]|uniref:Methionine/alanine importer small subunit n=1 Tax=Arthrobacter ginkgonis TaxID=1630594 RepID=A0ABP7C1F4_9MICC